MRGCRQQRGQVAAREEAPPLGQFPFALTCLSGGAHSAGSTIAATHWEEIALDQSGLCFLPVVIHLPSLHIHLPRPLEWLLLAPGVPRVSFHLAEASLHLGWVCS